MSVFVIQILYCQACWQFLSELQHAVCQPAWPFTQSNSPVPGAEQVQRGPSPVLVVFAVLHSWSPSLLGRRQRPSRVGPTNIPRLALRFQTDLGFNSTKFMGTKMCQKSDLQTPLNRLNFNTTTDLISVLFQSSKKLVKTLSYFIKSTKHFFPLDTGLVSPSLSDYFKNRLIVGRNLRQDCPLVTFNTFLTFFAVPFKMVLFTSQCCPKDGLSLSEQKLPLHKCDLNHESYQTICHHIIQTLNILT